MLYIINYITVGLEWAAVSRVFLSGSSQIDHQFEHVNTGMSEEHNLIN